jgi:hypothetical protein
LWQKSQELNARVAATVALRASDDEKGWSKAWRAIAAERKEFLMRQTATC